jgi:hypothetical protein
MNDVLISLAFIPVIFLSFGYGVQLLLSSDTNKKDAAIRNLFKSILSLSPVLFAVVLQLQGPYFTGAVACAIVLRLFSWPLMSWQTEKAIGSSLHSILAGPISSFALRRSLFFPCYGDLLHLPFFRDNICSRVASDFE